MSQTFSDKMFVSFSLVQSCQGEFEQMDQKRNLMLSLNMSSEVLHLFLIVHNVRALERYEKIILSNLFFVKFVTRRLRLKAKHQNFDWYIKIWNGFCSRNCSSLNSFHSSVKWLNLWLYLILVLKQGNFPPKPPSHKTSLSENADS